MGRSYCNAQVFLKAKQVEQRCRLGLNQAVDESRSANLAVGLTVPHFKKTAPFDFQLQRSANGRQRIRPSVLPNSLSKNEHQKGSSGFQCGIGQPRRVGSNTGSPQPPRMVLAEPHQQFLWRMRALPFTGCIFVRFCQGGVGVDGAQNFVQTQTMFHGQHKFCKQVTCVHTGNG